MEVVVHHTTEDEWNYGSRTSRIFLASTTISPSDSSSDSSSVSEPPNWPVGPVPGALVVLSAFSELVTDVPATLLPSPPARANRALT